MLYGVFPLLSTASRSLAAILCFVNMPGRGTPQKKQRVSNKRAPRTPKTRAAPEEAGEEPSDDDLPDEFSSPGGSMSLQVWTRIRIL